MKDAAQSIFNGIGKIEHGATKSNAEQESRVSYAYLKKHVGMQTQFY